MHTLNLPSQRGTAQSGNELEPLKVARLSDSPFDFEGDGSRRLPGDVLFRTVPEARQKDIPLPPSKGESLLLRRDMVLQTAWGSITCNRQDNSIFCGKKA